MLPPRRSIPDPVCRYTNPMAVLPSSNRMAVATAPSQTSYQSIAASGSHLNIVAKSSEMMPNRSHNVHEVQKPLCTYGAAYFARAQASWLRSKKPKEEAEGKDRSERNNI